VAASAPDPAVAPPAHPAGKIRLFARLIKVEHSVFALPFAYAGAFLAGAAARLGESGAALPLATAPPAAGAFVPSWQDLVWITVAMVGARAGAMAVNRLVDAGIDARNPRTAGREIPSGLLKRAEVAAFAAASLGLLVLAAFFLSPPCRYLWPIPVLAFVVYPYTKRFAWGCHWFLGFTDGLAPAAAWVAVTGTIGWVPVLLFLAVGFWIGGFDVLYGVFDLEVDRRDGLHSFAVRFGERASLAAAAASHFAAAVLLLAVGPLLGLGWVYYAGCAVVALLLAWSDADVARRGLRKVGMRFMTANGVVGVVYGVTAITAALLV
jgi:4-hydroxybenzoate polyprenyltransferase